MKKYRNTIEFEVYGDYALFSFPRPQKDVSAAAPLYHAFCNVVMLVFILSVRNQFRMFTRVGGEKSSYHIPTYEALKGIVESIYWKPSIMWIVDAVRIMKPIQTETKGVRPIAYNGGNELAYYTYLKDVCYQVRAHFEVTDARNLRSFCFSPPAEWLHPHT